MRARAILRGHEERLRDATGSRGRIKDCINQAENAPLSRQSPDAETSYIPLRFLRATKSGDASLQDDDEGGEILAWDASQKRTSLLACCCTFVYTQTEGESSATADDIEK